MIDEKEARTIAGQWHGGMMSAMYAFASSGTILLSILPEVWCELQSLPEPTDPDRAELLALREYLVTTIQDEIAVCVED